MTPSPWLSVLLDAATLGVTIVIAVIAHNFSMRQLAMQQIATLNQTLLAIQKALPITVNAGAPISADDLKTILANADARRLCLELLNHCEIFCGCVVSRTIDPNISKRIASHVIISAFDCFRPFIDHVRSGSGGRGAWADLESAASTWRSRVGAL